MNQQDTIKEKDKTIRNKYILNNMERVIWGLHHMTVEVADPLGCCAMWLGQFFLMFWRNIHLHLGLITLKMKAKCSFKMLGRNYPTTQCTNPKDLALHYKTSLPPLQAFSTVSCPAGSVAMVQQYLKYWKQYLCSSPLSLSHLLLKQLDIWLSYWALLVWDLRDREGITKC